MKISAQFLTFLILASSALMWACGDHSTQGAPPASQLNVQENQDATSCSADSAVPIDSANTWDSLWKQHAANQGLICQQNEDSATDVAKWIGYSSLKKFMDPDSDGSNDYPSLRIYFASSEETSSCLGIIFANVDDGCNDVTDTGDHPYMFKDYKDKKNLSTADAQTYHDNGMNLMGEYCPEPDFSQIKSYTYNADSIWNTITEFDENPDTNMNNLIWNFALRTVNCDNTINGQPYCSNNLNGTTQFVDIILQPRIETGEQSTLKSSLEEFVNFANPCPHDCGGSSLN